MFILNTLVKEANKRLYTDFAYDKNISSFLPISLNTNSTQIALLLECFDQLKISELLDKFEVRRLLKDILLIKSNTFQEVSSFVGVNSVWQYTDFNTKIIDELSCFSNQSELIHFIDILKSFDEKACLVGGCIRDILSDKKQPKDFDFVSSIDYDRLRRLFENSGCTVDTNGKAFCVMRVIVPNGKTTFEVANFRKEGTYTDGRRPDSVSIGTIEDDALRRDFSINSLYFNLYSRRLIDPTGNGISDLMGNNLRFNGKADERIKEDSLRVFRAYRFLSQGWTTSPGTLSKLRSMFQHSLNTTNHERIRDELEKICNIGEKE